MLPGNRSTTWFQFFLLFGCVLLSAYCLPSDAEARFWFTGTVSSVENRTQGEIEVDGIRFVLMPDAVLKRDYEVSTGEFRKQKVALRKIVVGRTVRMLVEGHRIYQLVLDQ